jgi:hypothetical protein
MQVMSTIIFEHRLSLLSCWLMSRWGETCCTEYAGGASASNINQVSLLCVILQRTMHIYAFNALQRHPAQLKPYTGVMPTLSAHQLRSMTLIIVRASVALHHTCELQQLCMIYTQTCRCRVVSLALDADSCERTNHT